MFNNFIEESFDLIYKIDYCNKDTWAENNDEVSHFIKELKEISKRSNSQPDLVLNNKGLL